METDFWPYGFERNRQPVRRIKLSLNQRAVAFLREAKCLLQEPLASATARANQQQSVAISSNIPVVRRLTIAIASPCASRRKYSSSMGPKINPSRNGAGSQSSLARSIQSHRKTPSCRCQTRYFAAKNAYDAGRTHDLYSCVNRVILARRELRPPRGPRSRRRRAVNAVRRAIRGTSPPLPWRRPPGATDCCTCSCACSTAERKASSWWSRYRRRPAPPAPTW